MKKLPQIISLIVLTFYIIIQGIVYYGLDKYNGSTTFIPFLICTIIIVTLFLFLKFRMKKSSLADEMLALILALYGFIAFSFYQSVSGGGVPGILGSGQFVVNNHGDTKYISYLEYKTFQLYTTRIVSTIIMFIIWCWLHIDSKHRLHRI